MKVNETLVDIIDNNSGSKKPLIIPHSYSELATYYIQVHFEDVNALDYASSIGGFLTAIGALSRCAYNWFPRWGKSPVGARIMDSRRNSNRCAAWGCVALVGLYVAQRGLRGVHRRQKLEAARAIKRRIDLWLFQQRVRS